MDDEIRAKPEAERTEKEKKLLAYSDMLSQRAEKVTPTSADAVAAKTTETNEAKESMSQPASPTVISAPTVNNSSNTVNQQSIRLPTRSQDMTFGRYVMSRFAVN
jgi:hypothetical protein